MQALPNPTPEEWRPVTGYEGLYEVSDHGRVRSVDRVLPTTGGTRVFPGRLRKPSVDGIGRVGVSLSKEGKVRLWRVHVLVLAAFVGPRPDGLVIRHLNGNPGDNRVGNLDYGTRVENQQDMLRHGTNFHANKTHCPKGHAYAGENLRVSGGRRVCRACANAARRDRWHRRKAELGDVRAASIH